MASFALIDTDCTSIMEKLLSTKEIAEFLGVNEKMIYTLINEKELPATKITGKWLFPKNLVEQWVESRTINYPRPAKTAVELSNLLLIAGSNDVLLERTISLFRKWHPEYVVMFSNQGSLGGLQTLRRGACHIAGSHLEQEEDKDYNFSYATNLFAELPAVVNFCRREQGLIVPKGNPLRIRGIGDIGARDLTIANRPLEASTRLFLDREIKKAGLDPAAIKGYEREFQSHLEVGLEVLNGRADTGPAIHSAATLLGLDFVPLKWERYDLLIPKENFFSKGVQWFLELLQEEAFRELIEDLSGYDLSLSGKMVYPQEA
jgi:excisionase family DNA binding protein